MALPALPVIMRAIGPLVTRALATRGGQLATQLAGQSLLQSVFGSNRQASPDEPVHTSSRMAAVLKRGGSFGDVMAGKKKVEDVEKEIEGEKKRAEAQNRFSDAIKRTTGLLGSMALTVVGVVKGLNALNAATIARQAQLAEVSPGHAAAVSRSEAQRIFRDVEMGRRTAGSFAGISKAQADLERSLLPIRATFTTFSNALLTALTKLTTAFITFAELNPAFKAAHEIAKAIEKRHAETGVMPWVDLIDAAKKARAPKSPRKV